MRKRFNSEQLNTIINELITTTEKSKEKAFKFHEMNLEEIKKTYQELDIASKELKENVENIEENKKLINVYREELVEETEKLKSNNNSDEREYKYIYKKTSVLLKKIQKLELEHTVVFNKKNNLDQKVLKLEKLLIDAKDLMQLLSVSMKYLESDLSNLSDDFSEAEDFILKIVNFTENDKRKTSRDIHDGPAQYLAYTSMEIQNIKEISKNLESKELEKRIENIDKSTKEALKELRYIIYDLRPMALDDLGLIPTVKGYLKNLDNFNNINLKLNILDEEINSNKIPELIQLTVFRVIQESISNAIRHSNCSSITMNLSILKDKLLLTIEDNGIGFDLNKIMKKNKDDFGILGMKERIAILNGDIKIKSSKKKGTKISIELYYENKHPGMN